jgi:UDP-glucuronate 4-epimerase
MATLITGGCGFVGINLAEALAAQGEVVVLFDRHDLPRQASDRLQKRGPAPVVRSGDVRDASALESVLRELRIQRIIHAAVITAGAAREAAAPAEIIDVNVNGTISVLAAAKAAGCGRVLCVGSGSAYGSTLDESGPLREELSPSRPETLYGITKFAAEQVALRLAALWKLDVVCARLGTVFGPWEFDTGARDTLSLPLQLVRLAMRGEAAALPAEARRDWVYSRDVASGLAAIVMAARPRYAMYHLTAGGSWKGAMLRWCEMLSKAYPQFSWRIAPDGEPANVTYHADRDRALMDVARLAEDIGFKPGFGPQEAFDDYLGWIRGNRDFLAGSPHC